VGRRAGGGGVVDDFAMGRGLGDMEGMKVEAAVEQVAEGDSSSPGTATPMFNDG
jgi:hypothetical protein